MVQAKKPEDEKFGIRKRPSPVTSTDIISDIQRRDRQSNFVPQISSRGTDRFRSSSIDRGRGDPLSRLFGLQASIGTAQTLAAAERGRTSAEIAEEERIRKGALEEQEAAFGISDVESQIARREAQTEAGLAGLGIEERALSQRQREFGQEQLRLSASDIRKKEEAQRAADEKTVAILQKAGIGVKRESDLGVRLGLPEDIPSGVPEIPPANIQRIDILQKRIRSLERQKDVLSDDEAVSVEDQIGALNDQISKLAGFPTRQEEALAERGTASEAEIAQLEREEKIAELKRRRKERMGNQSTSRFGVKQGLVF